MVRTFQSKSYRSFYIRVSYSGLAGTAVPTGSTVSKCICRVRDISSVSTNVMTRVLQRSAEGLSDVSRLRIIDNFERIEVMMYVGVDRSIW